MAAASTPTDDDETVDGNEKAGSVREAKSDHGHRDGCWTRTSTWFKDRVPWRTGSYVVSNTLRYAFTFMSLILLLWMVVTINEALNFQQRVTDLSGKLEDGRRVLVTLDELMRTNRLHQDETLPYSALAVKLDQVRGATESLRRFDLNGAVEPPPSQSSEGQGGASDLPPPTEFDAEFRSLVDGLKDLEGELRNQHGAMAIADRLAEARSAIDDLKTFAQDPFTAPNPAGSEDMSGVGDVDQLLKSIEQHLAVDGKAYQETLSALVVQLQTLDGELEAVAKRTGENGEAFDRSLNDFRSRLKLTEDALIGHADGIEIAQGLRGLNVLVEQLQAFDVKPAEDVGSDDEEALLEFKQTEQKFEQLLADVKGEIEAATAEAWIEPQHKLVSARLSEMEDEVRALAAYRFVPLVRNGTNRSTRPGDQTQNDSKDTKSGVDEKKKETAENIVKGLEVKVDDLKSKLTLEDKEFRIANEIAVSITDMEGGAEWLRPYQPKTGQGEDGSPIKDAEALGSYHKGLNVLDDAIKQLKGNLTQWTAVNTVADSILLAGTMTGTQATGRAESIIRDFDALGRFTSFLEPADGAAASGIMAGIAAAPKRLATMSGDSLRLVFIFVIGAIGSVIYIVKTQLQLALQGHTATQRPRRPFSWLLFRPFFGVAVALAVYLTVRAGQLALGSFSDSSVDTGFNLPILSVVALFAGLLSWQALDAIESRGQAWFRSQSRRDLWATGLDQALRNANRGVDECAAQIGRSVEQVERWLMFRDKVPPEMQDRIATWLERSIDELFSDTDRATLGGDQPLWASGLGAALDDGSRKLDAAALAEMIGEKDADRVRRWINLDMQVAPPMQWRVVDALNRPHRQLFDATKQKRESWAVGLRAALEKEGLTAENLADALALDAAKVHTWIELEKEVPEAWQSRIASHLRTSHGRLFNHDRGDDDFRYATGLGALLEQAGQTEEGLAQANGGVDVEPERIRRWLAFQDPVGPATQRRVAAFLGLQPEDVFEPTATVQTMRWATGLDTALADKGRTASDLARKIGVGQAHVLRWMAREHPVPKAVQRRIAAELKVEAADLFKD